MLPYAFATVTLNVCGETASALYAVGDEHATATPLSSEHVVVVGDPVVDQEKLAFVDVVFASGVAVSATVGGVPEGGGEVTLQLYVAELLPNEFDTVTLNQWDVTASEL